MCCTDYSNSLMTHQELRCGLSTSCSSILTRVIGYGGLERNFIGNRPCNRISIFIFKNAKPHQMCDNIQKSTMLEIARFYKV